MADVFNLALTDGCPERKANEPVTFVDFVRRHEAALCRYLRSRAGNAEDVSDLMQECFMRLLRYVDTRDEQALERLMFRIANNLLTDNWRADRVRHSHDHVPLTSVELANESPSQERAVAAQQRLEHLKAVIRRLPPRCQAVFIFSRIQGLSHTEIARKCGISVKAVEKHVAKALAVCRAEVGDDIF